MSEHPDGYLATPVTGNGGAVLVLHAWWGLNDTFRGLCDRLADAGYLAFAPDLYHGRVANTIDNAENLMRALDDAQAGADLAAATDFLYERGGRRAAGLAVIGFSMGANYALELAERDPARVGRVVLFYGTGRDEFSRSRAAYQGHFAAKDEFEEQAYIDSVADGLRRAGCPVTFYTYPDTAHWFFEPDRPEYNAAAADLAWERTLAFLDEKH